MFFTENTSFELIPVTIWSQSQWPAASWECCRLAHLCILTEGYICIRFYTSGRLRVKMYDRHRKVSNGPCFKLCCSAWWCSLFQAVLQRLMVQQQHPGACVTFYYSPSPTHKHFSPPSGKAEKHELRYCEHNCHLPWSLTLRSLMASRATHT